MTMTETKPKKSERAKKPAMPAGPGDVLPVRVRTLFADLAQALGELPGVAEREKARRDLGRAMRAAIRAVA